MSIYADRVREETYTSGTGTITLSGTLQGFRTFSSSFSNGDKIHYCIENGIDWEVGSGTYNSNTLSRDYILSSSNSNNLVDFPAGKKEVLCVAPAEYYNYSVPINYISGLEITPSKSAANYDQLSIAAGTCKSSTNLDVLNLTANISNRSIGNEFPTGLRPSGITSITAGDTLHLFLIRYNGTINAMFDTDLSATNILNISGVTSYRRIGSLISTSWSDSSGGIIYIKPFIQIENEFVFSTTIADINPSSANISSSPTLYTLDVPSGIKVMAKINITIWSASNIYMRLEHPDTDEITTSDTTALLRTGGSSGNAFSSTQVNILTNTSKQIKGRTNSLTAWFYATTVGYKDFRR